MTHSQFAQHARSPACAHCGGTGYVYLWSIPRVGDRVWYCDRSGCKRSWSSARSFVADVAKDTLITHELQPLVVGTSDGALQPV